MLDRVGVRLLQAAIDDSSHVLVQGAMATMVPALTKSRSAPGEALRRTRICLSRIVGADNDGDSFKRRSPQGTKAPQVLQSDGCDHSSRVSQVRPRMNMPQLPSRASRRSEQRY